MQSVQGITQVTTGLGVCGNPFILTAKASCTLTLQVNGSQLHAPINDGPIVCEQGSSLQCYRPALSDILHIRPVSAITDAAITVTGSPLTLTTNGPVGTLTINNSSLTVAATNITSNFMRTALDGNVIETGNTCASVGPQSSCTLTYTPGSTVVAQTSFPIQGSNTHAVMAAIQIDAGVTIDIVSPSSGPAVGGTGVTLTGSGFTGVTSLTFGGTVATSLNVVSSTIVTAVTPPHAIGAVDVVITTPSGSATATNGYTYLTTAVGQSAYGGIIACLEGGLNNLIAATADANTGIVWGGSGVTTSATSSTDGAFNTETIVACLTGPGGGAGCPQNIAASTYAAGICSEYEVDSQGNTPCESNNACYDDWFLPSVDANTTGSQLNCLYANRTAIGGFDNAGVYWSSKEANSMQANTWNFVTQAQGTRQKTNNSALIRCVRALT